MRLLEQLFDHTPDTAFFILETGYGDPLTPASLARIAKLPAARFVRIVKRIFGVTPIQLIAKTRIAAASRLLRETTRSIAEIAHACGFYDHSAFTRAFRAVVTMRSRAPLPFVFPSFFEDCASQT